MYIFFKKKWAIHLWPYLYININTPVSIPAHTYVHVTCREWEFILTVCCVFFCVTRQPRESKLSYVWVYGPGRPGESIFPCQSLIVNPDIWYSVNKMNGSFGWNETSQLDIIITSSDGRGQLAGTGSSSPGSFNPSQSLLRDLRQRWAVSHDASLLVLSATVAGDHTSAAH